MRILLLLLLFSGTCFAQPAKVDAASKVRLTRDSVMLGPKANAAPAFTYDSVKVVYHYINPDGVIVSGKGYEVVKRYLASPGEPEIISGVVSRLDKNKKILNPAIMASVPIRFNWKK